MEQVPGISFRVVPDPTGDSGSFLSWFLPSADAMGKAIAAMKEAGIMPGNFYWFANNWHYIKKWDHLKNAHSLYPFSQVQQAALKNLANTSFAKSDAIMSRCISTAISLVWTEEQVHQKGATFLEVLKKALS
jgi:8-amino-3,8-dideoxy-alpha-D-manno-octulosonate transaminase